MIWNFFIQIGIALLLSGLSYVLAPKPKQAARQDPTREFDDPTADVGRPIPVVFGTVNVKSPNVLFFSDKGSRTIKRKSRAEYRMTLHYGICQGPIDNIRRVRINEKAMLGPAVGEVLEADTDIDLSEFNGGKDKEGGIEGRFLWQDGAFDQVLPAGMAEPYGEPADNLPAYRGIATAMFREQDGVERKGFLWGQSPFIPPAEFMVTRIPQAWYPARATIEFPSGVSTTLPDEITAVETHLGPNCNPAHIIRELMIDSVWGAGIDEAFLDNDSFEAAADIFHDEGLGLSFQWDASREVQDLIADVLEHIEAVLFASPLTGLFVLRPLRGGYDADTLDVYDEANSEVLSVVRRLPGEIPNEVALTWTNPGSEKSELVTLQNLGGVARAGTVIGDNAGRPGIRDVKTAWEVAERELVATTEEALAVEVELDRRAWGMVPGDVFKLTSEDHLLDENIVRVIRVDYGNPREPQIKVNAIEDVFGRTMPQFTRPGQGGSPGNVRRFRLTAEDGGVLLDWNAPESDGGSPILRYEFQQDGGAWQGASGLATSHRVSGLVNGQTYTFRVRAVNLIGPGIPSVQLRIGPDDTIKTAPTAPRDFQAIGVGDEGEISWVEPLSDGGATIIRYEYELEDSGEWVVIPESDEFLHRIAGLDLDAEHEIRLRAVNSVGAGTETFAATFVLRDGLNPANARPPQAEGFQIRAGIGVVALLWDSPFGYYQNHSRTLIYRNTLNDFSSAVQIAHDAGIMYPDRTAIGGESYWYWIAWESQTSVIGDAAGPLSLTVAETPSEALTQLSNEIRADSFTRDLLSPIDRIPSIQAMTRQIVQEYLDLVNGIIEVVELDAAGAEAFDLLDSRVEDNENSISSISSSLVQLMNTVGGLATSAALATLRSRVTVNENSITSQASSITSLMNTISGLATATAVQSLVNRVTMTEGDISSLSSSVTSLMNDIMGLATSTALNALTNRVTSAEGTITSQAASITQLMSDIMDRASAAALQTLATRVTSAEGTITSLSTSITQLMSDIMDRATSAALQMVETRVTSAEGTLTSQATLITALQTTVLGLATTQALMTLETRVTTAEGFITSQAASITQLMADVMELATAAALMTLETRVTTAEGSITSQAASITQLMADVMDRATSAALQMVETRVTSAEGSITSQAASITQLMSDIMGMATATAFMELTARVTSAENVDGTTTLAGLARWLVKTQVNQLTGGVGLLNDGSSVKFYVAANRFAIIPPGDSDTDNSRLPFVVQGGVVYINVAAINNATIGFAKMIKGDVFDLTVGDKIESDDFATSGGFRLEKDGGLQIRGSASGERMEMTEDHIRVYDSSGTLRVEVGNLS